jgi:type II secretory pathway component PulF
MVIRVAIWTPIALLCWYAFFFGLDLQLFYPLPTGLLIIAAIVAMGINRHRAVGQAALLELMAAAVERGIPLASAARAFGGERRGRLGRRARRLAELLDAGMPLREALKAVPRLLPPQAAVLLCVGSDAGALAPALRQATAARIVCEPIWQVTLPKLCYVCFMPFLATGLFIFIAIKIIPQFEKIFKDFGTRLAPMTQALIDAGCWIANYWYLTPLPWVLAAIGGLLIYLGLRYAGLIGWDLPGMGWIVRRLDTAAVLDALALAAGRQRPIDQAIATLAECYPKPPIRRRLAAVLAEVRGGADWCRSLRRHGLVRQADMAVLESAARAGNLPWALGEMADSNRRRFTYRAYAAVQLAFPPIVLAYGLVVALVVVALFLPLIQLIRSLA